MTITIVAYTFKLIKKNDIIICMRINLHCHSNKSDGANTPTALIDILAKDGLDLVALTDHDSLFGIPEAKARCEQKGINLINGIEFSASLAECPLSFATEFSICHLLAYGFDLEKLQERIKVHHYKMKQGVIALVRELHNLGYRINEEELPDSDFLTAYDVARLLVKKDYASGIWAAFDNIIGKAKNRRIFFCGPKEIITMVHDCGGLIFLAHPFDIIEDDRKIKVSRAVVDEMVPYLIVLGIDGIEGFYQPYNQEMNDYVMSYAKKNNLLVSYGTDFHGGRSYVEAKYYDVEVLPNWIKNK